MFKSANQPLLHNNNSPYFSHHFYIFFLFFGALIFCTISTHRDFHGENAVSGNELSAFDLGYESDEDPFHQRSPRPVRPQNANNISPPISSTLSEGERRSSAQSASQSQNLEVSSLNPPTSPEYKSKSPHPRIPQAGSPKFGAPDLHLPNIGSSSSWKGPLRLPSMGSLSPSSSQAGPSGLPQPLPPPEQAPFQEPSPELSVVHVEDEGSHDEVVAPNADIQAPVSLTTGTPVQCSDPVNGFQAKVGSCGEYYFHSKSKPQYHSVRLTKTNHQIMYLVEDTTGLCEGSECTQRDMETCCKLPKKCNPGYITDVQGGCPGNKVVNPYGGAFCKTFPCTPDDQTICCINQEGALFERTDIIRSNFAKTSPDDQSPFAEPRISFGHHDIAWFDMTRKRTVGADEWAPLVNFMEFWKPGVGWKTEAWVKISKKGKQKYQQLPIKKMFPPRGILPRAVNLNRVREHH